MEKLKKLKDAPEEERISVIAEWQSQEEKLVIKNPEAEVQYLQRIAEIKLAGGFLDDAQNDFYDAIDCARGHRRDDLADQIRTRMQELESQ